MGTVANEAKPHWTEDLKELEPTVRALDSQLTGDRAIDRENLRLYYLRPEIRDNLDSPTGSRIRTGYRNNGENLTRVVVDAGMSMICREVQVKLTPIGADFETQRACEDLQELLDSVDETGDWKNIQQRAWLDGANCRAGFVKTYGDPATCEVKDQRLNPLQCVWDDTECENGEEPLSFYYVDAVPRRRLMAAFPELADKIKDLPTYDNKRIPGVDPPRTGRSDNVKVIEAWSRALGVKGTDGYMPGRHVLIAPQAEGKDGGPLVLNEKEPDFKNDFEHLPISPFRFSWQFKGYGGIPLTQIIANYDLENKSLRRSKMKALRAAVPIIWKHISEEMFQGLTDEEFQEQEYNGDKPPVVQVPEVLSKELLQTEADNRNRAMAEAGVNPELAQGNRPGKDLNSEPAIKAAVDTSQIRLVNIQERWGEFHRDHRRAQLMVACHMYKHPEARQKAPNSEKLEKIWKDNEGAISNLRESKYLIQAKLASGLSLTWAGRLSDVESLKKVAPMAVSEGEALRIVNVNDFETMTSRLNAPQELAEKIIWDALKRGIGGCPPTDQALLAALVKTGRLEYFRALSGDTNYPAENVELLRKVVEKANERLQAISIPPPGEPAPGGPPQQQPAAA